MALRHRPRTFGYRELLPYVTETEADWLRHLDHIIENIYVAIEGNDCRIEVGSTLTPMLAHWVRELHSWLDLKFDMPLETRLKLTRVFYALALGATDGHVANRFASTLTQLWSDRTLRWKVSSRDAGLDWKLLYNALTKIVSMPLNGYDSTMAKSIAALDKMLSSIGFLLPDEAFPSIWSEMLKRFRGPTRYTSPSILATLAQTVPPTMVAEGAFGYKEFVPTLFHIWRLCPPSLLYDTQCFDIFAAICKACMRTAGTELGNYGIFDETQATQLFSAILRRLEIPVMAKKSDSPSRFSLSEYHLRLHRSAAQLVVYSLTPSSQGMLELLHTLMNAVETFCHPSNPGIWASNIFSFTRELVESFVFRWNTQKEEETQICTDFWLNDQICEEFVQPLVGVTLLGIHSKTQAIASVAMSTLSGISLLAPDKVLPRLLKDVYFSLQGLERHRVCVSLEVLSHVTPIMARIPKYAIHVVPLLELAVPCIDANDLTKTQCALTFIHTAALSLPFQDVSDGIGNDVAMTHLPAIIDALMVNDEVCDLSEQDTMDLLKSSSCAFSELVQAFLTRVFLTLENLADLTVGAKATSEYKVAHNIPTTLSAILASVSPDTFASMFNKTLDFISNTVLSNAVDIVAHICGTFVKASPKQTFSKLFTLVEASINYEMSENSAGRTRSILPRDRSLVWYLSILNMGFSAAGTEILLHKGAVLALTMNIRLSTRGQIVYHTANTLHHAIVALITTYPLEFRLSKPGSLPSVDDWGYQSDASQLDICWHVPCKEEVEFAIELYSAHTELSLQNIASLDSQSENFSTETSDALSSNLTYVRTATSAIAVLVDLDNEGSEESDSDSGNDESVEGIESDGSQSGASPEIDDFRDAPFMENVRAIPPEIQMDIHVSVKDLCKYRSYPVNYYFATDEFKNDPMYLKVQDLRTKVGICLHETYLLLNKMDYSGELNCFKELLFAMKVWFSDLGYERSSKSESFQRSLYKYESRYFRFPGLRKRLPRPILIRRAYLYHIQRLAHNSGSRKITPLDKMLLLDLVDSAMTIYPDVHRNAEAALYSTTKVLAKAHLIVYPAILDKISDALSSGQFKRAKAGLTFLNWRNMSFSIKRGTKYLRQFARIIFVALDADDEHLNAAALNLFGKVPDAFRLSLDIENISRTQLHSIKPEYIKPEVEKFILKSQKNRLSRRNQTHVDLDDLFELTVNDSSEKTHWRSMLARQMILLSLSASPQMPLNSRAFASIFQNALSTHPDITKVCQEAIDLTVFKLQDLAARGYDFDIFRFDADETSYYRKGEDIVAVSTREPKFTESFLSEMENVSSPPYYTDKNLPDPFYFTTDEKSEGWLFWPPEIYCKSSKKLSATQLNSVDRTQLSLFASYLDTAWLKTFLTRQSVEPRHEEDRFDIRAAVAVKSVLLLTNLGYSSFSTVEFIEVVRQHANYGEKGWQKCLAELCCALLTSTTTVSTANSTVSVEFVVEIVNDIISGGLLSRDTIGYWVSFIRWTFSIIDYRRAWPVVQMFIDVSVNEGSGFKDSFILKLRTELITSCSWLLRHGTDEIMQNLCDNIGHPLQKLRNEVSKQLSVLLQCSFYEGLNSFTGLLSHNRAEGPLGDTGYKLTSTQRSNIIGMFDKLETLRITSKSGDDELYHTYIRNGRSLCFFLDQVLCSPFGVAFIPLAAEPILPALLHLSNIREDPELISALTSVFTTLASIPCLSSEISPILTLLKSSLQAATWHQKLRILLFIQPFYSTNLFLLSAAQREETTTCIITALNDNQAEVRHLAAETLSGIVRCSSIADQNTLTESLSATFTRILADAKSNRTASERHAAVLGLGALVNAFPYKVPPPKWVPDILVTLAARASNDSGIVGQSVKRILGDFKRTRQDTWHIDQRVFSPSQLENLEGVLWKNYFV